MFLIEEHDPKLVVAVTTSLPAMMQLVATEPLVDKATETGGMMGHVVTVT
jgi:hypothetical protein